MTFRYWQRAEAHNRQFLWNAKPRFGKTLAAYDFAKSIHAQRILIITNRPAVADSWTNDFFKYIAPDPDNEYIFASAKASQKSNHSSKNTASHHIYSRSELIRHPDLLTRPLIFFISLQDIKGKDFNADTFKDKNQWIFDLPKGWDLLIIDEGHEGIKTSKTANALRNLKTDFTLYLSGTPFRALADQDFSADQIFNWTYLDEQKTYHDRPRLHFQLCALSDVFQSSKVAKEPPICDLSELFRTSGSTFLHPDAVSTWLDFVAQIFEIHPELRHTFWLLSRVNDCKVLQLALSKHPYFRDYQTILAAGKPSPSELLLLDDAPAHKEYSGQTVLRSIRSAIGNNPSLSKTITLSCGQLTTGITIPEWSGVFMLYSSNDLSRLSSAQYLQTVFRAQNPAHTFQKPEAYVFDFAPDRALTVLQDYAENLCNLPVAADTVSELLRYTRVEILNAKHSPTALNADEIIELPRRLIAAEIVDGGFITSNKLFNIQNIFHTSPRAREVIGKLYSLHKNRLEKSPRPLANPTTKLDLSGEPVPNIELINEAFHDVLRSSKYAKLTTKSRQQLRTLALLELAKVKPSSSAELPPLDDLPPAQRILFENALREIKLASRRLARRRQKKEEDSYRDKLRGFSRTIPMLLHLYGEPNLTFADFSTKIPPQIFYDITGITPSDFELLRREQYFNETNCNLAIQEFMRRERKLSRYFLPTASQDIFDFIPLQYGTQVFTPKTTARKLLSRLETAEPGLFKTQDFTFFDPSARSGIILAEIVKQLFRNSRPDFSTDRDCLLHILTQQIYSWSPDKLSHRMVMRTVLSFVHSKTVDFTSRELDQIHQHFVCFNPVSSQNNIDYKEVQTQLKTTWKENMKFDVIISNPPYQLGRRQIYADFYRLAVDLDPELLCMVFPQGWQKPQNHNGLGQLNNVKYKRDPHIVSIDNYDQKSAEKLFPNIGTGGVNIVLRNRAHNNHGKLTQLTCGENPKPIVLPINPEEVSKPSELTLFIEQFRYLPKVESLGSARKPYGLYADPLRHPKKYHLTLHETRQHDDDVRLFGLLEDGSRGYRYVMRKALPKVSPNIDHYKLFIPKAWGNMATNIGLGGSYSNICVASPGDVCSETFIEFGPFASQNEAIKAAKYFMTKFFRALLFLAKDSQNTAKDKYHYIPLPDFNSDLWQSKISDLDEQLFDLYEVPSASREFILRNLQPRSEANIEIL